MLLEVLNVSSNLYSNLYSFRTLAAIYRTEPELLGVHSSILISIVTKALNPGIQSADGTKIG